MTKKDRVLALMRKGWLTPATAYYQVGCLSLSQRVGELIRDGVKVEKEWLTTPSGARVRAYRVAE